MAEMNGWTLGRCSLEEGSSALVLRGLCLLDWGEPGGVLSHPLVLPSGQGCILGLFSQGCSTFHLCLSGDCMWRSGGPSRQPALPSPPACRGAAGLSEPQRKQLVMSKSCQEKSQIPPHGFSCSSPRCCWLADGRGQQLGWWLGCSLLPCQKLRLCLRWPSWGRR